MQLRQRLKNGEPLVGLLNPFASTDMAEMLGTLAYDFVMFDLEHGAIDVHQLPDLARAVRSGGSVPLVRVPDDQPKRILQVLDAGMAGTMVPQVNTAQAAAAVAQAHRYPPAGTRSLAVATPAGRWGDYSLHEHGRQQDETVICIAQVETAEGLADVAAIAATPGLDAVLIGPYDLSVSLGQPGQPGHPDVQAAIADIAAACRAASCPVGIYCRPDEAARYRELGISMFLTGFPSVILDALATHRSAWQDAWR